MPTYFGQLIKLIRVILAKNFPFINVIYNAKSQFEKISRYEKNVPASNPALLLKQIEVTILKLDWNASAHENEIPKNVKKKLKCQKLLC